MSVRRTAAPRSLAENEISYTFPRLRSFAELLYLGHRAAHATICGSRRDRQEPYVGLFGHASSVDGRRVAAI